VPTGPPAPLPRRRPTSPPQDLDASAIHATVRLISGKWVPHVLVALADRPMRHGQLKKVVGKAVNDKVFTQTLRRMESDGLLLRSVLHDTPPAVLYLLSPMGRSLLEPLRVLTQWQCSQPEAGDTPPRIPGR